jgi:hypothetical protein
MEAGMNLLRCVMAGVASLVVGAIVLGFGAVLALKYLAPQHGHAPMAYQIVAMTRSPIAWAVALVLFALGFIGEYRRSA